MTPPTGLLDLAVCLALPQLAAEQGNTRETLLLLSSHSRTSSSLRLDRVWGVYHVISGHKNIRVISL